MNKKDTIIIAVLINAGLLAILFMLAINTDEDRISDQTEIGRTFVQAPPAAAPLNDIPLQAAAIESAEVDEVDNFLRDLAASDQSQIALLDDEGSLDSEEPAPPVKPEVKAQPETRLVEVTVKRGDALEKIARSNATTVEAIKKINNLSSTKLVIGQVLKIPVANESAHALAAASDTTVSKPSSKTPQNQPAAAEPQYYTVKSGDNPWKIAKQFQVKFEDLLKLNNLDEEKARNLKVGDKIRVR